MKAEHPIKQLLLDTRALWDHTGTPAYIGRLPVQQVRLRHLRPLA